MRIVLTCFALSGFTALLPVSQDVPERMASVPPGITGPGGADHVPAHRPVGHGISIGRQDPRTRCRYAQVNSDDNMRVEYGTPKTVDRLLSPVRDLFDDLGKAIRTGKTAYLTGYGRTPETEQRFLLDLGTSYRKKEFESAFNKLQETARHAPGNADVYASLGNYYQMRKRFNEAVAAYQQAIARDRYHLIAYDNLGKIYYAAQYYGKAYVEFDAVRRRNPYYAEPYFYMGKILAMQKNPQQAIAFLLQYLRLAPAADKAQQAKEEIARLQKVLQEKNKAR